MKQRYWWGGPPYPPMLQEFAALDSGPDKRRGRGWNWEACLPVSRFSLETAGL